MADLSGKADRVRSELIRVSVRCGMGHIAPSLSCVDILTALYYGVMTGRDRLVLSKGHGCYGLYAILSDLGRIPKDVWEDFRLSGCVERIPDWGLEASCGSLGHGLPMAVGMAFADRLRRVFCVVGDGEMQEGSNWEAVQFAVFHKLRNLVIIIDHNGLQAMASTTSVLDVRVDDLFYRLTGFGLNPRPVTGHDADRLADTLNSIFAIEDRDFMPPGPVTILAQTCKGFGLSCAENRPEFHFRVPTDEEMSNEQ